MQSISATNHSIYFNENGYSELNLILDKSNYSKIFILVDEHTNEFCLSKLLPNIATNTIIEIIEIEAGEDVKNIATCLEIWSILSDLGGDRKSVIINLGGGVITDLGGFVASTFKRGIDFINIPTTLLGMVDAAIGGKNGVDLENLKNQIGVITNPKMILVDTNYLETLSTREIKSGLAEMLKHGLIYDKNYWNVFVSQIEKNSKNIDFDDFDALIYRSIEIKNEIVSQDPTENGIRKALNFGHTLGHAIESHFLTTENQLLHGEAIAIGMILESYISKEKNLISSDEYFQIKYIISEVFERISITENDILSISDLLIHDKKNEYGTIQFTLLKGIGNSEINQVVDFELINKSFIDYKS